MKLESSGRGKSGKCIIYTNSTVYLKHEGGSKNSKWKLDILLMMRVETVFQNLWDAAQAVLRRTFIAISTCIREDVSCLILHSRKLQKGSTE